IATAFLLSKFVPDEKPHFDPSTEKPVEIKTGGKVMIYLGAFTIFSAVISHQVLGLPAMWGMMFGLTLLQMYAFLLKRRYNEYFDIFTSIRKIENDTLLFFFGILSAVGALHFLGYLSVAAKFYDIVGSTTANIGVGLISAVVDNVPVMSAVLKANPDMGVDQWLLVTMTAGIGGSLISFGSAAGVGVMGRLKGIYTFMAHIKLAWTVAVGYVISITIWYVQFEVLGLY
ncbi:MAG: sodium:proton antiporter NhaD, partial [Campylobacterales bacterium]|nr:sodium:proton antiporter NhaD [Campylobacterales bacterium]